MNPAAKHRIEALQARLLATLREIVGMHPRLASGYEPGWTAQLPDMPADTFDAAPKPKSRKRRNRK